jgi:hypothetical protein
VNPDYRWGRFTSASDNSIAGGILLVLIRGLLLWVLIPVGSVAWALTVPWSRASLTAFLGWLDNNQIFLLQRTILRPAFPSPSVQWIRFKDAADATHRIRFGDMF